MSGHNNVNRRILHRNIKSGASQLLPRFSPTAIFTPDPSTAAAPDPKTSDPAKSTPTPAKPTTPAQTPSPPPPAKTSTTPVAAPSSSSSSSSSTPATSTTPTSTLVPTTSSTPVSTPSPVVSTTPALATPTPTLPTTFASSDLEPSATGIVLPSAGSASSSASTPTSSPSSNAVNTAGIVGGIAGGLAGLAILGFLIMFCMRRYRKRDEDDDVFNPDAFKRQSAILVDDPPPPPPVSYNPRPPTMIERKLTNASPALAVQQGYGQPTYGGAYGIYGQNSFGPGELVPQIRSPPPASHQPFSAYGQSPLGSPASVAPYDSAYNQHGQLNRHPSNATYLNRQDSMMNAPYGMAVDPSAHYVDLNRSSVTPFQAAQYADITRRLASNNLNGVSEEAARGYAHDQPEKPLPSPYDASPFHDSAAPPAAPRAPSPVHTTTPEQHASTAPELTATEHSTSDDTSNEKKRPDTMYTVYEPGDAYAGFE